MVPAGDRSLFQGVWDKNAVDAEVAADVMLDLTETQASEALSKASKAGMKVQQLLSYSVAGVRKYAAYLLARNSSRSGWRRCLVICISWHAYMHAARRAIAVATCSSVRMGHARMHIWLPYHQHCHQQIMPG
jgi:hypothetical protein